MMYDDFTQGIVKIIFAAAVVCLLGWLFAAYGFFGAIVILLLVGYAIQIIADPAKAHRWVAARFRGLKGQGGKPA